MSMRLRTSRTAICRCLVWSLVGFSGGCGDGIQRAVPVKIKVFYKGEPLKSGEMTFIPVDPTKGRPATAGSIGADGCFTPTSRTDNDGLFPGDYKAAIRSYKPGQEPKPGPGPLGTAGLAIPARYVDTATSGLTVSVGRGDAGKEIKVELPD